MKKHYNAFTLTEMLVALGVVAVLCAIILPMIYSMMPNKNVIMAKRSYYTIQTIVAEMINDSNCYPNKEHDANLNRRRYGFGDGYGYTSCTKWGGKSNKGSLSSEERLKKFNTLFFDKLGISAPSGQHVKVATDDGVQWAYTSAYSGGSDGKNAVFVIHVDVNGSDGPNCGNTANGIVSACKGSDKNPDQYTVNIQYDGKIELQDDWAKEAVDINNAITR